MIDEHPWKKSADINEKQSKRRRHRKRPKGQYVKISRAEVEKAVERFEKNGGKTTRIGKILKDGEMIHHQAERECKPISSASARFLNAGYSAAADNFLMTGIIC